MSESDKKKNGEKKQAELETPTFAFSAPADTTPTFSLGTVASDSEIKPFVFGSDDSSKISTSNADAGLSHTASITSLMEQRSKMANARRKNKTQDTAGSAAAVASKNGESEMTKQFVPKTDSTTIVPFKDSSPSESSTPFVFSPGEAFSPGTSDSVSRPSSAAATRQRRAGRGRSRNDRGGSGRSSATGIVSPSQASITGAIVGKEADGDKKPKATVKCSPGQVYEAIGRKDPYDYKPTSEPKGPFERASKAELKRRMIVRATHPAVEYDSEDSKEEPGGFARAPSSVLKERKVVHAKWGTGITGGDTAAATSTVSAASAANASSSNVARSSNDDDDEESSFVKATRTLLEEAREKAFPNVSNDSQRNVARVVSDGDDDEDSMPPLEPARLDEEDTSNERNEDNVDSAAVDNDGGEEGAEDNDDDADSRANPYAALRELMDEESSEEENEESSDEEQSEEDSDDEEDSESECMCSECVSARWRNRREAEMDDDVEEDSDDQCCICFGSPTSSNRMAVLPCCGSENGEDTSTVKFCNKCIVKCLKSQASETESLFNFFGESDYLGECPRCRSLICVPRRGDPARRSLVERPTFHQAVRYALRDQEKGMRPILYTACCVYPNFLPVELFDGDEEKLKQLCRWGILNEVRKGEVYAIDPEKQETLKDIAEARFEESEDDDDDNSPFSTTTIIIMRACVQLFLASFYAIMKFKIIVSCRMFNQGISMFMVGVGALPKGLHKLWQRVVVTCLNMLLLTMLFQVAFLLVAYILIGYGTVKAAGWWLSTPNFKSFSRRMFYSWVVGAAVFGAYHMSKYDLLMYSSMAIGTFAGGCHVSGKSMTKILRDVWAKLP